MANLWHYKRQGEQFGPFSDQQLKQLAVSGKLQPSDMVQQEGSAEWVPANRLKGLFPTSVASPLATDAPLPESQSPLPPEDDSDEPPPIPNVIDAADEPPPIPATADSTDEPPPIPATAGSSDEPPPIPVAADPSDEPPPIPWPTESAPEHATLAGTTQAPLAPRRRPWKIPAAIATAVVLLGVGVVIATSGWGNKEVAREPTPKPTPSVPTPPKPDPTPEPTPPVRPPDPTPKPIPPVPVAQPKSEPEPKPKPEDIAIKAALENSKTTVDAAKAAQKKAEDDKAAAEKQAAEEKRKREKADADAKAALAAEEEAKRVAAAALAAQKKAEDDAKATEKKAKDDQAAAEKQATEEKAKREKAERRKFGPTGQGFRVVWNGPEGHFIDIHVEQTPTTAKLVLKAHNFADVDNANKRLNEVRDQVVKDWHKNGSPYKGKNIKGTNHEEHKAGDVWIRTIEFRITE